jgi:hypothetical protein
VGRTLHPNPDHTIDRRLTTGPKCEAVFAGASQTPQQVYERIELPPIRPDVTQVRLFGGRCACCGERATAKATAGLEQGSPFGHSIARWSGVSVSLADANETPRWCIAPTLGEPEKAPCESCLPRF